jgi:uncharacterized protein YecE (DUF72 family)
MSSAEKMYIGTSGWSYPKGEGTWNGYFYPGGKINELEYYSQFFNTVEINSSFYRPPDPGYVYNWAKHVPRGFLFAVKLWQKFTHPKMYKEATGEDAVIAQSDVDLFKKCLEPLMKYDKLGALLAQFPPSFKNDAYSRQILTAIAGAFSECRIAVELRHRSWSDDEGTADLLREHNMALVQIDEPKFGSSVAAEVPVTADFSYFRFHGRNAKEWWTGDTETRYRYLYSEEEISGLAERVKAAVEKTNLLFAFFNNHWQAYAPKNASDLKKALGVPSAQIPLPFQDAPVNLEFTQTKSDTGKKKGENK